MFWEFLFKLFRLEWEVPRCAECDHLRLLIEQERAEKSRLLNVIIEMNVPESTLNQVQEVFEPLKPKFQPWSMVKQQLEKRDSLRHIEIINKQNSVEELEKELGITEETTDVHEENVRQEKEG